MLPATRPCPHNNKKDKPHKKSVVHSMIPPNGHCEY